MKPERLTSPEGDVERRKAMPDLNETPTASRFTIGIFGRRKPGNLL
jgi:hypothetical protein